MAEQPIIIKRIKKGGHAPHGGAWKVAYADFVTAMMAFFLLLWLLNSVTEEQLEGISNYFAPTAISFSPSGAGGLLGGQVLGDGASQSDSGSPSVDLTLPPPTIGSGGDDFTDPNEGSEASEDGADQDVAQGQQDSLPGTAEEVGDLAGASEQALAAAQEAAENAEFEATAQEIQQAIQGLPELQALGKNLMVDQTPEGLRIQLVDQDGLSMFPSGSSNPADHTRRLLGVVATAIRDLPNKISVAGHTDNVPFNTANGYGNWELSADRALASRRVLLGAGLADGRIERVEGKASMDPLLPDNPGDPQNRRITVTLLRDHTLFAPPVEFERPDPGALPGTSPTDPDAEGDVIERLEDRRRDIPSILDIPASGQL
ncbi:MAG: flagellar motor protein MotB [Rhodospirillaceae bacterium]